MSFRLRAILVAFTCFSPVCFATGFNFWESSTSNSALASANGAKAVDASILATAPSSMTQLQDTTVTASVTQYQVDTDYNFFGDESSYSKSNPIPAGFLVAPVSDQWYLGMAAYSRTAADISVPQLLPMTGFYETRVKPIVVSFAPSVAYKVNDSLSLGLTLEYQYASYLMEEQVCPIFRPCTENKVEGTTSGWSGALSATWTVNQYLSLAASHKLESSFGNDDIQFELPSITSLYATVSFAENWHWHNTYSLSRFNGKGIYYTDYSDPFGLLQGVRHSKRYATSMSYDWGQLTLRGGVSIDKSVDPAGGNDYRYRLGLAYRVTDSLILDLTGFVEDYAKKEFSSGQVNLVEVQNQGSGVSLGVSYAFK